MNKDIFKAYDIRGIYPSEINEDSAKRIGQAYVSFLTQEGLKNVVVGADVRNSSPSLKKALIEGITSQGVNVFDIGTISTDMMYFATVYLKADGGITISASHNPAEYNGMKIVRRGAIGISGDTGLQKIRDLAISDQEFSSTQNVGKVENKDILQPYLEHVRKFIDFSKFNSTAKKIKILLNGNFGLGAKLAEMAVKDLPVEIKKINYEPDGNFPKGAPDPMKDYNRAEMAQEIVKQGVDLGVAWDADADRVFFYTSAGKAVEGYFITSLLAQIILKNHKGEKVIHDPRLTWANDEAIMASGGIPIESKTGHMFIKERMRAEDAVFAGEMSAHYYFKDNFYADNGIIPFLLIVNELLQSGRSLPELIEPWTSKYFTPGEINFKLDNASEIIQKAENIYGAKGKISKIDGLSVEFDTWRFNLRTSNTEPLLRLNLESKISPEDMEAKLAELKKLIKG